MRVPQKIYLWHHKDDFCLRGSWLEYPFFNPNCTSIEYIRKDTLLKWLEEQRDDAGIRDDQLDPDAIIEYNTYQTVIDELNEV